MAAKSYRASHDRQLSARWGTRGREPLRLLLGTRRAATNLVTATAVLLPLFCGSSTTIAATAVPEPPYGKLVCGERREGSPTMCRVFGILLSGCEPDWLHCHACFPAVRVCFFSGQHG